MLFHIVNDTKSSTAESFCRILMYVVLMLVEGARSRGEVHSILLCVQTAAISACAPAWRAPSSVPVGVWSAIRFKRQHAGGSMSNSSPVDQHTELYSPWNMTETLSPAQLLAKSAPFTVYPRRHNNRLRPANCCWSRQSKRTDEGRYGKAPRICRILVELLKAGWLTKVFQTV